MTRNPGTARIAVGRTGRCRRLTTSQGARPLGYRESEPGPFRVGQRRGNPTQQTVDFTHWIKSIRKNTSDNKLTRTRRLRRNTPAPNKTQQSITARESRKDEMVSLPSRATSDLSPDHTAFATIFVAEWPHRGWFPHRLRLIRVGWPVSVQARSGLGSRAASNC